MTANSTTITLKRPRLPQYQKDFLYCEKRFTVVEASTKTGKTFSHIYWIYEISHGKNKKWYYNAIKPGMNFWWVAPVFSQSKIAFNRLKRRLEKVGGKLYKFNLTELTITTPLGSIIWFKSADKPDSLYGEDVYAVVFDEFTRAKSDAWAAIRSTLTFTKGPAKFIGNYTGSTGWGHKLSKKALKPNSEYAYFKVSAYDAVAAGILEESEIEQAREDLPLSIFTALYLAEGVADDTVLFPENVLEDAFTNNFVEPSAQKYISADIALHGSDRFVLVVWDGLIAAHIYSIDKCDAEKAERFIKSKATTHRVPRRNIVFDADGVGAYLKGYLKTAISFNNGSSPIQVGKDKINYTNLKAQCFYLLSKYMNDNKIWIKTHEHKEQIMLELENIRKDGTDKDGKIGVTKKDALRLILGFSPDFADALMMRMVFELPRKENLKVLNAN